MYDFRQKRRAKAAKSRPPLRAKKVVLALPPRKRLLPMRKNRSVSMSRSSRSSDSKLVQLGKALGSIALATLIIAICVYFFMTKMATYVWPLQSTQTLLLTPPVVNQQPWPFVQMVVLDPESQTVQLAELPGTLPLSPNGDLTVSTLSQTSSQSGVTSLKLGRVVDETLVLPDKQSLRTHSELKRAFQDLLQQDTPQISKADKFRWWLFVLSLSDTDVKVKSMATFSNWQSWLASVAQQQPTARCSVALINTTTISGLSRFMSQVIEQSGYQVIRVDSQPKFLVKSQLFVTPDRPACTAAAERLQQFLPEDIEIVQDAEVTQQARADIVWLLGEDVAGQAVQVME